MYEFTTDYLLAKPTDFKMCVECKRPNWYENEYCTHLDCTSTKFRKNGVIGYIKRDYKFYRNEGYSEEEIDNILIET
jgi:hypothetical protein